MHCQPFARFLIASSVAATLLAMPTTAQDGRPALDDPAADQPAPRGRAASNAAPTQADRDAASARRARLVTDTLRSEAKAQASAGNWEAALDYWNEVLKSMPGDKEALDGVEQARAAMNQGSMVDTVADDISLLRQRREVEAQSAVRRATELKQKGDFDGAMRVMTAARLKIEQARDYLTPGMVDSLMVQIDELIADINESRTLSLMVEQDKTREQASRTARDQQRAEQTKRDQVVNENIRRVRELQLQQKYDEALTLLDATLTLDRYSQAALALRDAIETAKSYRDYSVAIGERARGYTQMSKDAIEGMIAPRRNVLGAGPKSTNGKMVYPEDWRQLSLRRSGAAGFSDSAADAQVLASIESTPVNLASADYSLEQAIDVMEKIARTDNPGLNIVPDWRALAEAGIDRETRVRLDALEGVPMDVALTRVLEQYGEGTSSPAFTVTDGMVVVSTPESIRRNVMIEVYDIRDLLLEIPYFDNAPDFSLEKGISQGTGDGLTPSQGGQLFGAKKDERQAKTRESIEQDVMDLIQMQTADVGDWKDQGGNTGSISPMNGNLIVTNTAQAHREIEGLLNKMREVRALQIAIEARLINVDLEWFEQIGIDFDLYFNSNPAMYDAAVAQDPNFQLRDFFFQNIPGSAPPQGNSNIGRLRNPVTFTGLGQDSDLPGAFPNSGGAVGTDADGDGAIDYTYPGQFFNPVGVRREGEAYGSSGESNGFSPVNVQQEGLPLVNALAAASQSPFVLAALGSPALSTGFTYLDDVQIDLLVQATQADQRNSVLTAPRLTLFNGQRSWISIAKGITYVSGLEPITGNNAAGFEPETNVVFEGFVLDLDAVISADRRYVTMNVRFGLNENVSFTPVTVTGAAGGGGGDGGGGRASQFSGTIQLPSLQGSEIRTSVSVPDKGTIMLGGQILMNEIEIEVGVPVLSKIPIVNRFFTNRLTTRSEKTQMLLIRPEIMIQQEMEDDLFPDLRSQLGEGSAGGF